MSIFKNNRSKKKKDEFEDDGRTIVNMNVDGMPWYVKGDEDRSLQRDGNDKMSDEEVRLYKWAALKSALLIVLVFAVVFFLFLAFCDFIWFR